MVCLPDQLPLLKFGDHEAVSYEARWLVDEITKAAAKAGHEDWFFAKDITRAVIEYLRHRHPRNTITIEELYHKIEHVLGYLGCADIAESLEIGPPPVRVSLSELAKDAGALGELAFFTMLGERVATVEDCGATQIVCDGIRGAAKRLSNVTRWTPECERMNSEIVAFITRELLLYRPQGSIDVIIK